MGKGKVTNMRKIRIITLAAVMAVALLAITACGSGSTTSGSSASADASAASASESASAAATGETISIGCMTSSQPIVEIMKKGLEDKGYTVDIKIFDENNMPCTALKDGDINGVILNHKVWLDTFNKNNGSNLVMAEPYIYYSPMRLYSVKYKSADEFPDGATIAVPSDPANLDRSLRILEAVGLIKLGGEKSDGFNNRVNIVENPKNIQLIEAEITTAAKSINDADAVISPAQYIGDEGTLGIDEYIYDDPESKEKYPLGLIVAAEDVDSDWVKAGVDYMLTDEAIDAFNTRYNGAYVLYNDK